MIVPFGYLVVFTVDLLATSGDIALSWTSPMLPKLQSNDSSINPLGRPITKDEDSWIASLLNIVAAVGSFPFSIIADKFGRRIGLIAIAVPFIVSYLTLAMAKNLYWYYFARAIGGLAIGGGYALLPLYIAEVSKDSNRGAMSQTLNVFWAIGNFIPYAIGPFISIFWFNVILACLPASFLVIFSISGPESPYYLVKRNKIREAENVLMKLRSKSRDEIQSELSCIKTNLKQDDNQQGSFFDILTNRKLLKIFIMCLILVLTQELSGFCAIMYHLEMIFAVSGTNLDSGVCALIVGFASMISSLISPCLIDRAGRRFLIISSCIGMFLALALLSIFFYIQDETDISINYIFWVPIFSLILYIFSFNFGICCVPWTLISEIFPTNVKHIAASSITSITWITSFLTTSYYNTINSWIGLSGTFCFYSLFCIFAAIYSTIAVPETKNKSFSEIQEMIQNGKVDRKTYVEGEILLHEIKT
ncbi:unnamed protein product [Acanthoscelides obtectus]|uniref:Major facilitator superfamily (MFS) profile domain-containing protein n=2 Tax=Acanthoscelides obtectus TaxID=200917 RepID=A0A9P0L0F8_ACAOB|nr:unnamed protein product [Acanthoscelides obtectus]CAK1651194.1 Facilitated trehalose transporter Tret1 [Acanthoscelides obtectus]